MNSRRNVPAALCVLLLVACRALAVSVTSLQESIREALQARSTALDTIRDSVATLAFDAEFFAKNGIENSALNLSSLTFVGGSAPYALDNSSSRISEFLVSTGVFAAAQGGSCAACQAERDAFCTASASELSKSPGFNCTTCTEACSIASGLRLSSMLDSLVVRELKSMPICSAMMFSRSYSADATNTWSRVWQVMDGKPITLSPQILPYVAAMGNPNTPAAMSKSSFDRNATWTYPTFISSIDVTSTSVMVTAWSEAGTPIGAMNAAVFVNGSVIVTADIPVYVLMVNRTGELLTTDSDLLDRFFGQTNRSLCSMSDLPSELSSKLGKDQGSISDYGTVTIDGTAYVYWHYSEQTVFIDYFAFALKSKVFPADHTAMIVAVSVVVPLVVIGCAAGVGLFFFFRHLHNHIKDLHDQLGQVGEDLLGTPAEDVVKVLLRISSSSRMPKQDKFEIARVIQLIAANKLYKADVNLKEKLGELKLDKDVDAYLVDFLANKAERDGTPTPSQGAMHTHGSVPGGLTSGVMSAKSSASGYSDRITRSGSMGMVVATMAEEVLDMTVNSMVLLSDGRKVGIDSWDMDVELLEVPPGSSVLEVVGMALMEETGLLENFSFKRTSVIGFFRAIERGYNANPYHNSYHAADVTQAMHCLLNGCEGLTFTPLERLACIIAPVVHDFGHPGLNNNYMMATMDPVYVRYNGISVLESMHVAESMRLLLSPDLNFLKKKLSKEEITDLHRLIVQLILATDMARHLEITSQFNARTSSGSIENNKSDRLLVMQMMLKMADVSNPTRPWEVCRRWSERVMEEFFAQGDKERSGNMKLSPFMDRLTTDTAKCQSAFIKFVVQPMVESLVHINPSMSKTLLTYVSENGKRWANQSSAALNGTVKSAVTPAQQAATQAK